MMFLVLYFVIEYLQELQDYGYVIRACLYLLVMKPTSRFFGVENKFPALG